MARMHWLGVGAVVAFALLGCRADGNYEPMVGAAEKGDHAIPDNPDVAPQAAQAQATPTPTAPPTSVQAPTSDRLGGLNAGAPDAGIAAAGDAGAGPLDTLPRYLPSPTPTSASPLDALPRLQPAPTTTVSPSIPGGVPVAPRSGPASEPQGVPVIGNPGGALPPVGSAPPLQGLPPPPK